MEQLNLKSMQRLSNENFSQLFSLKDRQLDRQYLHRRFDSPAVVPPTPILPETPDTEDFLNTNNLILEEQRKQTSILEEGFESDEEPLKLLKQDEKEKSNFVRLEASIKEYQEQNTTTLSERLTESFEKVGKKIVGAIFRTGKGGGEDLIDEIGDLAGGAKKGKPGIFRRATSKTGGVLKRVASPVTRTAGLLGKGAAKLGGTSALTALSGGAGMGTAAMAVGGVLAAGAAGAAIGTGINAVAKRMAGREDWLLGWVGDYQEEKARNKARVDNLSKWKDKISPDVLRMLGGKDEFDPSKFVGLRMKGLIVSKDGVWYTKGEYDLMEVDGINSTTKRAEGETEPFPTNLIDIKDNITSADKKQIEELLKKKHELQTNYSSDIIAEFTKSGSAEQVKKFMESYKELEAEADKAVGKDKEVLRERMAKDNEVIQDLTGKSFSQLQEAYKEKIASQMDTQLKAIRKKYTDEPPITKATPPPPLKTTKRVAENLDIVDLKERQVELIGKLKADRIDSLQNEIDVTKEKLTNTTGYFNKNRLTKKIQELQAKKATFEAMTDDQYSEWLTKAMKDAKESLKETRKMQGSAFVSPAYSKSEIDRLTKESKMLQSELTAIGPAIPSQKPEKVQPTMETPPPSPTIKSAAEDTKAKKLETREKIRTGGKPEVKTTYVPIVQTQKPDPTPNVRKLTIDDPKVDLLRTIM